ncbi:hypothetical protein ACWD4V_13795 [Streptomyces tsukubensis]
MVSLPPPRRTELHYGGQWNDISSRVRESTPVVITRGVTAEGTRADPGTAQMRIDNRDGSLSPLDPMSVLYGDGGRNTPLRVALEAGGPYLVQGASFFDNAGLWTPDSPALTVTGDLDLRVDIAITIWPNETNNISAQQIVVRWDNTAANQRCWTLGITRLGQLMFGWSSAGTFATVNVATSTASVRAYPGQRLALRVTLDVNNGASGRTIRFYWAPTMDGPWQQLGAPVVQPGTTSVFDGTAILELGSGQIYGTLPDGDGAVSLRGRAYGLQLRSGIDGPVKVDLDIAATGTPGATSITDTTGLPWTIRAEAVLSNRTTRFVGEVPSWEPGRDRSGSDVYMDVTPTGIMRRLGTGTKPLDSGLLRYIQRTAGVLECWPLTDGEQATWGSSLRGGRQLLPQIGSTGLQWAAGAVGDWIEPVLALKEESIGSLHGTFARTAAAAAGWAVDFVLCGDGVDVELVLADFGAGTDEDNRLEWTLECDAATGAIQVFRTSRSSTSSIALLGTASATKVFDGRPHAVRIQTEVAGATTYWSLHIDGIEVLSGSQPLVGKALRRVELHWDPTTGLIGTGPLSIGYLTYWGAAGPPASEVHTVAAGSPGEAAGARVLRLAAEQGVPTVMRGAPEDQARVGIQRPAQFLETLQTAATTDLAFLLEQREAQGLLYRGSATLCNQSPMLVLDFSAGVVSDPFRPAADDKATQNDVTVRRDGGGFHTAVQEQGRMSVQDPPLGVGRYDTAQTLPLYDDFQPVQHAEWRMHLGTYAGPRYTKITVDLANPRVYALIDRILRADVGDLIRLANLPPDHGPDDVDLIIRGYTEEISADRWRITFNCAPGEPWRVPVLDDPQYARMDTAGSQLTTAVTTTSTTFTVSALDGRRWVTPADDSGAFPFDAVLGGERVRVTAISGTGLTQTWTVVRSVNGVTKSHPTGADIRLANPVYLAL